MRFLIITHVKHQVNNDEVSAYAPYVREMNLWLKHVNEVTVVAPQKNTKKSVIDLSYKHDNLFFKSIPSIEFTSITKAFSSIIRIPLICYTIINACKKADHIHLRCPGNIGLLGCLVQILFPSKVKTAKYAGNWDPGSQQPISYKFQKWLLSNTFLTKNMTAIVYGDWKNQTKNIKSFFTATFSNTEREVLKTRNYSDRLKVVFIGSLVGGKRPLFAIKIIEALNKIGHDVTLDLYGDGDLKTSLFSYLNENSLDSKIRLFGNQEKDVVKKALKEAHFLILPSKSEGWPKALAEAMFFGAIPISTSVSCVPYMLDYGNRGILIPYEFKKSIEVISKNLADVKQLQKMSDEAVKWSQKYTLEFFEAEIVKLLKK